MANTDSQATQSTNLRLGLYNAFKITVVPRTEIKLTYLGKLSPGDNGNIVLKLDEDNETLIEAMAFQLETVNLDVEEALKEENKEADEKDCVLRWLVKKDDRLITRKVIPVSEMELEKQGEEADGVNTVRKYKITVDCDILKLGLLGKGTVELEAESTMPYCRHQDNTVVFDFDFCLNLHCLIEDNTPKVGTVAKLFLDAAPIFKHCDIEVNLRESIRDPVNAKRTNSREVTFSWNPDGENADTPQDWPIGCGLNEDLDRITGLTYPGLFEQVPGDEKGKKEVFFEYEYQVQFSLRNNEDTEYEYTDWTALEHSSEKDGSKKLLKVRKPELEAFDLEVKKGERYYDFKPTISINGFAPALVFPFDIEYYHYAVEEAEGETDKSGKLLYHRIPLDKRRIFLPTTKDLKQQFKYNYYRVWNLFEDDYNIPDMSHIFAALSPAENLIPIKKSIPFYRIFEYDETKQVAFRKLRVDSIDNPALKQNREGIDSAADPLERDKHFELDANGFFTKALKPEFESKKLSKPFTYKEFETAFQHGINEHLIAAVIQLEAYCGQSTAFTPNKISADGQVLTVTLDRKAGLSVDRVKIITDRFARAVDLFQTLGKNASCENNGKTVTITVNNQAVEVEKDQESIETELFNYSAGDWLADNRPTASAYAEAFIQMAGDRSSIKKPIIHMVAGIRSLTNLKLKLGDISQDGCSLSFGLFNDNESNRNKIGSLLRCLQGLTFSRKDSAVEITADSNGRYYERDSADTCNPSFMSTLATLKTSKPPFKVHKDLVYAIDTFRRDVSTESLDLSYLSYDGCCARIRKYKDGDATTLLQEAKSNQDQHPYIVRERCREIEFEVEPTKAKPATAPVKINSDKSLPKKVKSLVINEVVTKTEAISIATYCEVEEGEIAPRTVEENRPELIWGKKVLEIHGKEKGEAFLKKVVEICGEMGFNPDYLMSCMALETIGTFKHDVESTAHTKAIGLIQFTGKTSQDLFKRKGKSYRTFDEARLAMKNLNEIDQLDYVKLHTELQAKWNKADTKKFGVYDVYLSIFYPKALKKKSNEPVLIDEKNHREVHTTRREFLACSEAYCQNVAYDKNKDGKIYKSEIAYRLDNWIKKGEKWRG